jgi:hypothetical protein
VLSVTAPTIHAKLVFIPHSWVLLLHFAITG